jgi:F-type H+-transporting ATPase subunit c
MVRKVCIVLFVAAMTLAVPLLLFAQEETKGLEAEVKQMIALAAGFGLGIAAFGGAIGQSRAISSALDSIGRNPGAAPRIVTPMIIGLAMIESLVIYSLVVSLLLIFKL